MDVVEMLDLYVSWFAIVSDQDLSGASLFCLSVIYMQKSLKRWKKYWFADTEKISGLNSIYFHAKTILFGDYFLAYFGL